MAVGLDGLLLAISNAEQRDEKPLKATLHPADLAAMRVELKGDIGPGVETRVPQGAWGVVFELPLYADSSVVEGTINLETRGGQ